MKCPNCEYKNRTGVSFCENCGEALRAAGRSRTKPGCAECGYKNRPGVSFCENCGAALAVVATAAAARRAFSTARETSPGSRVEVRSTRTPAAQRTRCPQCQKTNRAGVLFCENCGFKFEPQGASVENAPLAGPRKLGLGRAVGVVAGVAGALAVGAVALGALTSGGERGGFSSSAGDGGASGGNSSSGGSQGSVCEPDDPKVSVSPTSGSVYDTYTVRAAGFCPYQRLAFIAYNGGLDARGQPNTVSSNAFVEWAYLGDYREGEVPYLPTLIADGSGNYSAEVFLAPKDIEYVERICVTFYSPESCVDPIFGSYIEVGWFAPIGPDFPDNEDGDAAARNGVEIRDDGSYYYFTPPFSGTIFSNQYFLNFGNGGGSTAGQDDDSSSGACGAASPDYYISPSSGPEGTEFTLYVEGFSPGAELWFDVDGEDDLDTGGNLIIGSDCSGERLLDATWLPPGTYPVEVSSGENSADSAAGDEIYAYLEFTVEGEDTNNGNTDGTQGNDQAGSSCGTASAGYHVYPPSGFEDTEFIVYVGSFTPGAELWVDVYRGAQQVFGGNLFTDGNCYGERYLGTYSGGSYTAIFSSGENSDEYRSGAEVYAYVDFTIE